MGLSSRYQGFTREKTTVELEHYRPPGKDGIAITIRYAGKLSPDGVKRWRPVGRTAAILGDHIRGRVRRSERGPTGARLGPGEISGGMWNGLAASVTAKGRARVYFKGKSLSYRRSPGGGRVLKLDLDGKPVKVKNEHKALNVSGLGMVPERDEKGRLQVFGDLKDRVRFGRALVPKGFTPPRESGGRWSKWPESIKAGRVKMKAQQFASGKHRPVSILEPSEVEQQAVMSVLALGIEKLSLAGGKTPSATLRGDSKMVSKLRRGLGV